MANLNNSPTKVRRAEIAGGGFAGLTAAIALRQNGWDVRLHEKSSELRAFGAGIYLWHNGLRVLEGLGALKEVLEGIAHSADLRNLDAEQVDLQGDVQWPALARHDPQPSARRPGAIARGRWASRCGSIPKLSPPIRTVA